MKDQRSWWLVRCEGGKLYRNFVEGGFIALGREQAQPDLSRVDTPKEIRSALERALKWETQRDLSYVSRMNVYFKIGIATGDRVLTYNTPEKYYRVGTVTGDYEFIKDRLHGKQHFRSVDWWGTFCRNKLSVTARKSLGCPPSVRKLPDEVAREICQLIQPSHLDSLASD